MSTEAAIEVEGIVKHYGDVRALDGVDLRAPPVGRNTDIPPPCGSCYVASTVPSSRTEIL